MNTSPLNPFTFPTLAIIVDDSSNFLQSIALRLNSNLVWQTYSSPLNALSALNAHSATLELFMGKSVYSMGRNVDGPNSNDRLLYVDVNSVHQIAFNPSRFSYPSVLVVDYCMPEIDGVTFCKQIVDKSICKILLTGIADEKIAVDAFNEGVIDVYIRKQQPDALELLNSAVVRLQDEYLRRISNSLNNVLEMSGFSYLLDSVFAKHFKEICSNLNIVEYYVCGEPGGVVLLTAEGAAHLLLVHTEDTLRTEYEIAESSGASRMYLDRLSCRKFLPYHRNLESDPRLIAQMDIDNLILGTEVHGDHWYLYGLVEWNNFYSKDNKYSYSDYVNQADIG
jgi:CheY-like chemotaxis protein